jgi:serine/threonine protein kinase
LVDAKRILREIKLLRHFNSHENIITMYDIMTVPPNTQNFQDIYIVTNLMESDLERIIRSKQVLTNQHFQYFLYQILRALKYIHSANVLHRDLKPSNLLVNANCDLAVCDFGLSRGFDIEGKDTLTEYVVTRWYRAPELLCNSPHYGKAVDVWSIGCIFAELLTHDAFFQGDSPPHQLEVIVSKIGLPRTAQSLDFIDEKTARNLSKYINRPVPPFASWFPKSESLCRLGLWTPECNSAAGLSDYLDISPSVCLLCCSRVQPGPGAAVGDAAVQPRRAHHCGGGPGAPLPRRLPRPDARAARRVALRL